MRAATASILLAVALAACGGIGTSPSASLAPSTTAAPSTLPASPTVASPSGSAETTPSPAAPSAAATELGVDSIIEVMVSELVVRSAPGVDPATSAMLDERLGTGDRAFVVRGPADASGYEWYLVAPLTRSDGTAGPFGWVAAAGRDGDPWVRASAPACPSDPDLASVLALQPLERLACFGDASMTLEASHGACGAGGGPWVWEPGWLMVIGGCALALDDDADPALLMRVPPGVSAPTGGPPTVVRGHFDDPAAATCTVTTTDPTTPPPGPDEAVVLCRAQFVVEN